MSRYASPTQIPATERPRYRELSYTNNLWYNKAEALGWRQPDQVQEAKYMDTVNRAKAALQGKQ